MNIIADHASGIGTATSVILIFLGLVHVYWAAGGRMGMDAAVPQTGNGDSLFKPGKLATFAVALALFAAAALVAIRVHVVAVPFVIPLAGIGVWLLTAVFALRAIGDFRYVGFFKRVTGTRFARLDGAVYAPLCAILALLCATVALSGQPH